MPLPGTVALTTLTGTLVSPDGTPASGTLTLTPASELRDAAAHVVVSRQPTVVTLTAGGAVPAGTVLPASEQQRLYPSLVSYEVASVLDGVADTYRVVLPPGEVDWATVVRALPEDGVWASLRGPEGPAGPAGPAGPPGAPGGLRTPETYGAVGDGVTDDRAALQAWLAAGGPLHLPAGRIYRHHGTLAVVAAGTSIGGRGTLLATDQEHSAVTVTADDVTVAGITLAMGSTSGGRRGDIGDHKLVLSECARTTVRDVVVDRSVGAGIFMSGASEYLLEHCQIRDTLADSCHSTYGSHHGQVVGCDAVRSGDDGFACVSYAGDGGRVVHDVAFSGCRVLVGGTRGFSVVGGTDITWDGCHAQDTQAAAFYIASEPSFETVDVARVSGRNLSCLRANRSTTIDHGALFVWAGRPGTTVADVRVDGLTCVDTAAPGGFPAGAEVWVWSDGGTVTGVETTRVLCLGATAGELARDWSTGGWPVRDVGGPPRPDGWTLLAAADVYDVATTGPVSLAQTAAQLQLVVSIDTTSADDVAALRINGDMGAHYASGHQVSRQSPFAVERYDYPAETSARLSSLPVSYEREHRVTLTGNYWPHRPGRIVNVVSSRSLAGVGDQETDGWLLWQCAVGEQITSVEVLTVGGALMNHCRLLVMGKDVP